MELESCLFDAIVPVIPALLALVPVLAATFTKLCHEDHISSLRNALDELLWGETGSFVLLAVQNAGSEVPQQQQQQLLAEISFEATPLEACIGLREWLSSADASVDQWAAGAGFLDGEQLNWNNDHPGTVRCCAMNCRVEAAEEGTKPEKVQNCGLGLRIAGLPAPAEVGSFVRRACLIPCGGSNAVLREAYATRLPRCADWLREWTVFDDISFFRESSPEESAYRFMTVRLPIDTEALKRTYPSLASILSKLVLLRLRIGHQHDPSLTEEGERRTLAEILIGRDGIEIRFCVSWHDAAAAAEEDGGSDITLLFYESESGQPFKDTLPVPVTVSKPCAPMELTMDLTSQISQLLTTIEVGCQFKIQLQNSLCNGVQAEFRMVELPPTGWDAFIWVVFDIYRAREVFLAELYIFISWRPVPRPRGEAEMGPQTPRRWDFLYAIGSRVPRIGGCLSSVIRYFVANELGSGVAFLRDLCQAAAEDIVSLAAEQNSDS